MKSLEGVKKMRDIDDKNKFDFPLGLPQGRPPKDIDLKQLEDLASIQCTETEMCLILGISQDTMTRRKADPEFALIIERGRARGKMSLRRTHFQLAQTNPAVHIFACKNLLGMTDKPEEAGPIPLDQARRIKAALDAIDGAVTEENPDDT
jgi:hypothetical protein